MAMLDRLVLAEAGFLDSDLAQRLTQAAGFRNLVAHAYEGLEWSACTVPPPKALPICAPSSHGCAIC